VTYNPYMVGQHVYLRAPTQADVDGRWHEWFSDWEVTKYLIDHAFPNTREKQSAFLKSRSGSNSLVLSVIDLADETHIGVVSLNHINWVHRFADIAMVIGEKEYWSKGPFGLEAFALGLRIAFDRLNLRNLKGSYLSSNEQSRNILRLLRFEEVGQFRSFCDIDHQSNDLVLVQLSQDNWRARNAQ